jgi:hypothetical protein
MVSGSCTLPPRWPPQCSWVVIESSFDPGERLQAPGSLWFLSLYLIEVQNWKMNMLPIWTLWESKFPLPVKKLKEYLIIQCLSYICLFAIQITRDILPKNLKKCFGWLKNVWLSRIFYYAVSEWLLFNAKLTIFSYILARGSYIWWDDDVRFVLDQHALLDFNCASSLKQQYTDRHVAPLRHIILILRHHLCSLMLHAQGISHKYQFYSVLFNPTRLEPIMYCTEGKPNQYTTNAVFYYTCLFDCV